MTRQAAGISLGVDHVAEPEQHRPLPGYHGSRLKLRIGRSDRQRASHLQRITNKDHRVERDSGFHKHRPPEGQQPADPRILEDKPARSGKLLLEQTRRFRPVGLTRGVREPGIGNRVGLVPAGAGRFEQLIIKPGDPR